MEASAIKTILEGFRFNYCSELELQDGIERVFRERQVLFEREQVIAGAGRIDFVVGRCGVEVKINGSVSDVVRQLHRYAQSVEIESLLLVTRRVFHNQVPGELNGKKILQLVLSPL